MGTLNNTTSPNVIVVKRFQPNVTVVNEISHAGEEFGDMVCAFSLGDDFGDNEAQRWTDGVCASNRTNFNCICKKSC